MTEPCTETSARGARALGRAAILVVGIVLGQFVLYGPSLVGSKVLLPLDFLYMPGVLARPTPEIAAHGLHDPALSDLVLGFEPGRRLAASELAAGRWPAWDPYQFCGTRYVRAMLSPLWLLCCSNPSPIMLAWTQMAQSLVGGLGAFWFFRRVLRVGFWPAAIATWCYPLTAFFTLWQGAFLTYTAIMLPWSLLAVDRAVRKPSLLSGPVLALVTGLTLVSGAFDLAGQILLVSGLYAVWCLIDAYLLPWLAARRTLAGPPAEPVPPGFGRQSARNAVHATLVIAAGWGLGILLATPQVFPLLEFGQTGARLARRGEGIEERPPVGWPALPQVVLPCFCGSTQQGSVWLTRGNVMESSAATYTGLLATLLIAPLAWLSRPHRSINVFWCLLAVVGLAWQLNIPGLVSLLRMPLLNMASHNRFVFASSFAILATAAVGLDVLARGGVSRRRWFWVPAVLLVCISLLCVYRAVRLPEPVATRLETAVRDGKPMATVHRLADVRRIQHWFVHTSLIGAVLAAAGSAGWLLLLRRPNAGAKLLPGAAVFMVGELLWFGSGQSAQCDPSMYFPRISVFDELAKLPPGRIVGGGKDHEKSCFPPGLSTIYRVRDVRGYDAVDPARITSLVLTAAGPQTPRISYALTQWFAPRIRETRAPDSVRLPPVLDMLGVRYVLFRGTVPAPLHPRLVGNDMWVLTNPSALPRAFVPRRVETVADGRERLQRLADDRFDPREVAFVEIPVDLPAACRGSAEVVDEIPTRITLSLQMETAGLVVLADQWDVGWRAYLDGRRVPILQANHAVRGVAVSADAKVLEFRYEPVSVKWGVRIAVFSLFILLISLVVGFRRRNASPRNPLAEG